MVSASSLKIRRPFALLGGLWPDRFPYGISPEERFLTVLRRESARADRNGHGFSLVAVEMSKDAASGPVAGRVARFLAQQVRATDEIGWFEKNRIGVLLYNTPPRGAWRFVEKVKDQTAAVLPRPQFEVLTYPSGWGNTEPEPTESNTEAARDQRAGDASPAQTARARADSTAPSAAASSAAAPGGELRPFCVDGIPAWKRALDIVGAAVGLALLSPLFLVVAALIKIVSPGPVFFRQERVGFLAKRFRLWKFRTMHVHNDESTHKQYLADLIAGDAEDKPMTKMDDDPRIFRFGNLLRKSCIDELPQLINVLLGEMSLVGPRPPIPYEADEYLSWHNGRLDTVPGMTGLWQVSGKNRLTFTQMTRLDIRYTRRRSLLLDLRIILLTPVAIFTQIADGMRNPEGMPESAMEGA